MQIYSFYSTFFTVAARHKIDYAKRRRFVQRDKEDASNSEVIAYVIANCSLVKGVCDYTSYSPIDGLLMTSNTGLFLQPVY